MLCMFFILVFWMYMYLVLGCLSFSLSFFSDFVRVVCFDLLVFLDGLGVVKWEFLDFVERKFVWVSVCGVE